MIPIVDLTWAQDTDVPLGKYVQAGPVAILALSLDNDDNSKIISLLSP